MIMILVIIIFNRRSGCWFDEAGVWLRLGKFRSAMQ